MALHEHFIGMVLGLVLRLPFVTGPHLEKVARLVAAQAGSAHDRFSLNLLTLEAPERTEDRRLAF